MIKNIFLTGLLVLMIVEAAQAQDYMRRTKDQEMIENLFSAERQAEQLASPLLKKQTTGISDLVASIDEDEYVVDSGDEFYIKVDTKGPAFKVYNPVVTPDGYLVVADGPTVYVRFMKLRDARDVINDALSLSFPNAVVETYLNSVHPINVTVIGAVPRPAKITLTSSDRVFAALNETMKPELMAQNEDFLANMPSLRNVQIKRYDKIVNADILKYKFVGDIKQNPYLMDQDVIYVPYRDTTYYSVSVKGAVGQEVDFEYKKGDELYHALSFAGGLLPSADSARIEVQRFEQNTSKFYKNIVRIPGDKAFKLQPDDRIFVRTKYDYHRKHAVILEGALKYPGTYAIVDGQTKLTEVIEWVGGFTPKASLKTAKILRYKEIVPDKELERLSRMYVEEMNDLEKSYYRLRSRENNRLVSCDFEKLFIENEMSEDLVLRDMDEIIVPEVTKLVFVSGGVIAPGNVNFEQGLSYREYISLAGGFNNRARKGDVQIIKNKTGVWLEAEEEIIIEEGDIIFIPESEVIDWYEVFKEGLAIVSQVATIVLIIMNLNRL